MDDDDDDRPDPSRGRRSMGFWVGSLVGHVKVVNLLIYAAETPKRESSV